MWKCRVSCGEFISNIETLTLHHGRPWEWKYVHHAGDWKPQAKHRTEGQPGAFRLEESPLDGKHAMFHLMVEGTKKKGSQWQKIAKPQ